jgi:hypothetical protein
MYMLDKLESSKGDKMTIKRLPSGKNINKSIPKKWLCNNANVKDFQQIGKIVKIIYVVLIRKL